MIDSVVIVYCRLENMYRYLCVIWEPEAMDSID